MWTVTGLGFFIGALVPNKDAGLGISALLFVAFMLVSGFFVSQDNMIPVMYPFIVIPVLNFLIPIYCLCIIFIL